LGVFFSPFPCPTISLCRHRQQDKTQDKTFSCPLRHRHQHHEDVECERECEVDDDNPVSILAWWRFFGFEVSGLKGSNSCGSDQMPAIPLPGRSQPGDNHHVKLMSIMICVIKTGTCEIGHESILIPSASQVRGHLTGFHRYASWSTRTSQVSPVHAPVDEIGWDRKNATNTMFGRERAIQVIPQAMAFFKRNSLRSKLLLPCNSPPRGDQQKVVGLPLPDLLFG
jgi:hypothetical protein